MTINAIGIIPTKTASCSVMGDYAIKKKMNRSWAEKKVGDIVLFDFNHNGTSDHTGILEKINADGSIVTIEGNTSKTSNDNGGAVMRRTRTRNQVNYFVRPAYTKEITPAMLIKTAQGQLGVKEKPSGSNKVKYNTWFYGKEVSGSAYPWCMVFVCWLFAHIGAPAGTQPVPIVVKPSGKYSGTIPSGLLKRGAKGDAVGLLQRFLNWYHPGWKLSVDKVFGPATEAAVKSFQATEGIAADGEFGPNSYKKASAYKATKPTPTPTPKKYGGPFPDLIVHSGQKISETARKLAYPKGTSKATYTYGKGKATAAFTKAINRVFPKRSTWSKQCQAGASCDVGAATVIRASGIDEKIPRGLQEQIPYLEKSNRFKKVDVSQAKDMIAGDVGLYAGNGAHIWIGLGSKLIAEANHHAPGYFLHVDTDNPKKIGKPTWAVYRACLPTAIGLGDTGTEVVKLQKFLNWFNPSYKLAADGDCGPKTVEATKDFQKRMGLTVDGEFGSASLAKSKTCSPCSSVTSVTQSKKPIIDVSYWQQGIDWSKAATEISGAILRASYTSQSGFNLSKDSTFQDKLNGATRSGIKVGAYHYSQAVSVEEARKEAEYLCNILKPSKAKIGLPVVIDWEFGGRLNSKKAKALGKAKCTEIISAFCDRVTDYGFTPMVYANYSTFSDYLDAGKLRSKYLIWLAQYSSKPSMKCDLWQYTSSGSVKGIKGRVDMNKEV